MSLQNSEAFVFKRYMQRQKGARIVTGRKHPYIHIKEGAMFKLYFRRKIDLPVKQFHSVAVSFIFF